MIDLFIKDFIEDIEDIDFFEESNVSFGIHAEDGNVPKQSPDGDSKLSLLEVATQQEFNIPNGKGRSFIRSTFNQNLSKYLKELAVLSSHIIESQSKSQLRNGLNEIGNTAVKDVKDRIVKGIPPPLSEATIKEKTRNRGISITTPLIWTGQLINSIKSKADVK
jgi:hypothetical protein